MKLCYSVDMYVGNGGTKMNKTKRLGSKAMWSNGDRLCVDEGSVETSMKNDARKIQSGVSMWQDDVVFVLEQYEIRKRGR